MSPRRDLSAADHRQEAADEFERRSVWGGAAVTPTSRRRFGLGEAHGPGGRRMVRDVEMDDATPVMGEDEEAEQDLVAGGRHGEEVDRDQLAEMVRQECPPRLGRRPAWRLGETPGDSAFGNRDPEFEELSVNPRGTPERIRGRDAANQRPNRKVEARAARSSRGPAAPEPPEALTMPTNDRLGPHEDQGLSPLGPQAAKDDPEQAIGRLQPGATGRAGQNTQLVTQGEILGHEAATGSQCCTERREEAEDEFEHRSVWARATLSSTSRRRSGSGEAQPCILSDQRAKVAADGRSTRAVRARLQRQTRANARRCQRTTVSGLTIWTARRPSGHA